MNAVNRRRGALAVGLVLAMLLVAGCGMQTNQSTRSLDPLASTQHTAGMTLLENLFAAPSVAVAPQPAMSQIRLITFDRADRQVLFQAPSNTLGAAHSQAQSQLATQLDHYCTQ
jgi:hypothetical protein